MTHKVAFAFKKPNSKEVALIKTTGFSHLITNYKNIDSELIATCRKNKSPLWMEIGCFVGEELWEKFPLSRPTIDGKPIDKLGPPGNKWYAGVIPLPKVIEDRLNLINRLLNKYRQIEVIYLDFCRFPGR